MPDRTVIGSGGLHGRPVVRVVTLLAQVAGVLTVSLFGGCTGKSALPGYGGAGDAKSDRVDVLSGPHTETILKVVQDEQPLVLMDMLPEGKTLAGLTTGAQGEYLMKRALLTLVTGASHDAKFAEYDTFIVRMILLKDVDIYGDPDWDKAPEIAWFKM